MSVAWPRWAQEMRDLFKSGSVSQFILHGNVFDLVATSSPDGCRLLPLKAFLEEVMFPSYDVVLHYDRSKGIRATRGSQDWGDWLQQAAPPDVQAMVRQPGLALELIDRYLLRALNLHAIDSNSKRPPPRIAVVLDFAEFIVPRGESLQLGAEFSANVVKVLGWGSDPAIMQSNIATVLLTEGLHDLNELVAENPHSAKLRIPLPDQEEMAQFVQSLQASRFNDLANQCEVPLAHLSSRLAGLSRVGAQSVISLAINNGRPITRSYLAGIKKEMIERECQGLLEFLESPFTLDHVAGHEPVKAWLRDDAQLLKRMVIHALPMGYLITGRIGTGKTFVVQCWAGELGIPCVVF
jgi:hypothetical protein